MAVGYLKDFQNIQMCFSYKLGEHSSHLSASSPAVLSNNKEKSIVLLRDSYSRRKLESL